MITPHDWCLARALDPRVDEGINPRARVLMCLGILTGDGAGSVSEVNEWSHVSMKLRSRESIFVESLPADSPSTIAPATSMPERQIGALHCDSLIAVYR